MENKAGEWQVRDEQLVESGMHGLNLNQSADFSCGDNPEGLESRNEVSNSFN